MRILFISGVILVAFVILLVVTPGPGEDAAVIETSAQESIVENPFAPEESVDKDVNLASLPPGSVAANEPDTQETGDDEIIEVEAVVVDASQSGGSIAKELEEVQKELEQETVAAEKNNGITEIDAGAQANKNSIDSNAVVTAQPENVSTVSFSDQAAEPASNIEELRRKYLTGNKKSDRVAVIVHINNKKNVTLNDIKNMYMEKLIHWRNGSKISLYNLPLGDKSRERFSKHVLKMTSLKADQMELKRQEDLQSSNPPRVKAKNIIVSYVERDTNAIAYVPLSLIRASAQVKVVMTIP